MPHTHPVIDNDLHFVINPISREILSNSNKIKLMQGDHASEVFTFEIPRYIDGHDMSLCNKIAVHYLNVGTSGSNADANPITDAAINDTEDKVIFSWTIYRTATKYAGTLNFLIKFSCVEEDGTISYQWNSDIFKGITISAGMDNEETIIEDHYDILQTWRNEIVSEMRSEIAPLRTGITRVESLDTENIVQLRDLETGLYVLYGYFSPYADSYMTMTFDNTMVVVTKKTAGSHLLVFTGTDSKVNFLQIMADSEAPAGYTYTRTDFVMLDMHNLIEKVGELADLNTEEKSSIVAAINEINQLKDEKAEQKDFDLLVESVAIEHPGSNNLYNVETSTIGLLNVQGSINTGETNYYTSDYIRVQGGNTLYFAQAGISVMVACVAFYSDKDTNITGGVTWVKTADVPENAKYCRVCVSSGVNNEFAVNIGEIKPYDEYKDKSYEYKNQKDFDNIKSAISGIQKGWLCASLNNQIKNGNFEKTSGWAPGGGTISVSENTLTVTGNGTRDTISATSITRIDIGRKHFAFAYVRARGDSCQKIEINGIGGYVSISVIKPQMDKWYPIGFVDYGHASSMQNCFSIIAYYNSSDAANGQVAEIKEAMLIDITDDFGLGDNVRLHKMMAIVKENGWWSGEKNVKTEKLSVRQINNAENCYLLTTQTSHQAMKRPLVTFVNDDGWQDDFTKLSYISEKYNVPFVSAVFDGSTMNQWAMWYLQEHLGWEFAAHPRNTALAELQTEAEIEQAMLKTNQYMTQNGLICHNLVYPYGSHDERVRRIAKKYYHCACTTDPNGRNENVVASYALHRHPIGYGASDNSFERLKSKVDEAVENNAWLIFMLHPHMAEHTEELNQTIDDLIAYIKSIGVDIVTLNDGYGIFGNALECGDYIGGDTGIAIGYDGARANI